jgi:hypothetical protein
MANSGLELLSMFVPEGTDLLATCAAKENRLAVLMAGAGVILLGIAYTRVNWVNPKAQVKEAEPDYNMEELL